MTGPKRDINVEPLPIPASLMPEAMNDSHLAMRRSFNSAAPVPMQSMANIPIYRSFDQGASLASFARCACLISCFVSLCVHAVLCPVSQHRARGETKCEYLLEFDANK